MKTKVTNSRTAKKRPEVWRRRQCLSCHKIFSSYELPELSIEVTTETNQRHPFSLGKLHLSVAASFTHSKTAASYDSLDLAKTIQQRLITLQRTSLTAQEIAQETHATLKRFDELAAVQYAARHHLISTVRRRGRPSLASS